MDHRVPKAGLVISLILALMAVATFLFLNRKFEGPELVPIGDPYELTLRVKDSNTLPTKQPVLHKGVSVGRVNAVTYDKPAREAVVTFTIDEPYGPLHEDAVMAVGIRSLLGDAFLNLVDFGSEGAGELEAGDEVAGIRPAVDFDEALGFLDEEGRESARTVIREVGDGLAPAGNGARLNGTAGGLARTTGELRELTRTLRGQEADLAALTRDGATVLGELGSRERAIRTIVSSGRTTVDALAANTASLQRGIDELAPLMRAAQATLERSRPLLVEARPLLRKLRSVGVRIRPALEVGSPFSIARLSSDVVAVIEQLPELRRAAERTLPDAEVVVQRLQPLVEESEIPALNMVPIADYLSRRIDSISAFFANGASVTANSDEVGRYARFGVISDPAFSADQERTGACVPGSDAPDQGFCSNAYPPPLNARDPQPFVGPYPRLMPFEPPDPESLRP